MFTLAYILDIGPAHWPVSYMLANVLIFELAIECAGIYGMFVVSLIRLYRSKR